MLKWEEILGDLSGYVDEAGVVHPGADLDEYRTAKIQALAEKTGRNVVSYYAGWVQGKEGDTGVDDTDINGLVNAIADLDPSKGVDVLLHTPGGDPNAAEGIVKYLHAVFGDDVRVIVPQGAFSAGTMISCSAKEILMDKSASLGPIDPQMGGIPVSDMLQEMNYAKRELKKDPANFVYWQLRLERYPAGFYFRLKDAVKLSTVLVTEWLLKYMFAGEDPDLAVEKTDRIVKKLNSNNHSHGRHFNYTDAQELGLKVDLLGELESLVMDIHNTYMITFNYTKACKIIENQNGSRYVVNEG